MSQVITPSRWAADFERLEPRDAPPWLREIRRSGFDRFERLGFPTTREEDWRFTSVAPIASGTFQPGDGRESRISRAELESHVLPDTAARIVVVNGVFAPSLSSLPGRGTGVEACSLREAVAADPGLGRHLGRIAPPDRDSFVALNTAFLQDGAFVRIAAGTTAPGPIQLLFWGDGAWAVAHPRVLVVAGAGSDARIVESYAGREGDRYFANAVTEVVVEENAGLDHYKVIRDSLQAFHVASMHLHLGRDARVASHSITLGGALVRNEVVAVLEGEGIDCTLNGLYLADGDRLVDNHTTIDHARPHCASHEVYKGILDGRARAVFNGKIIVRPDAQKTDAKQTNKALLLSEDGQINTKPQLEIFADDVKCTHGATVGQLDEDAMFYLQARGIGREDARNMLIHAFAGDILGRVRHEALRERLERTLFDQLERAGH
jgi:Fe-S cluster assembly protein SufD